MAVSAEAALADLHVNFRLWIYADAREGVFGDGKARLLAEVLRTASLRQAAQNLGISYRKAWGDLRKAERCLGAVLVTSERGGSRGGRSLVTERGKLILAAYCSLRARAEQRLQSEFQRFLVEICS
jgi:molybdate transport repressor ModE-like protein